MIFGKARLCVAVVVVAGLAALAGCSGGGSSSGSPGAFGGVPVEAAGAQGAGTITMAAPPGFDLTWILPVIKANYYSYTTPMIDYLLYRPLYWLTNGVQPAELPAMSLADDPVWSNEDKTVTVTLKDTYRWSTGQPVTSKDILFWYDEVKAAVAASNWGSYSPGLGIPDEVASVATPNPATVVFNLKRPANPAWFWQDVLGAIQPMPSFAWAKATANGPVLDFTKPVNAARIYRFLAAASGSLSSYATSPLWRVVDGPYRLTAFDAASGSLTMAPNTAYGGPHATRESVVRVVRFTSDAAEFSAVRSGAFDVGYIPLTDVPRAASLSSAYHEFGYPIFESSWVTYNFNDTDSDFSNIIRKLYIRQAIAHLENQPGYVRAVFNGAAIQSFGPVPSAPVTPYTPANAQVNPYPFSPAAAAALLRDNGWSVVPNGYDTCVRPGTRAGECGAGIPAGTELEWTVMYSTGPAAASEQQLENLAAEAKQVGITMDLSPMSPAMALSFLSPTATDEWAMADFGGFILGNYPTTMQVFNTGGGFNFGGYADPTANLLISASVSSSDPGALKKEAAFLTEQQPVLFLPNQDEVFSTPGILVWKKTISGSPQSFEALTQLAWDPEYWFFTSKP